MWGFGHFFSLKSFFYPSFWLLLFKNVQNVQNVHLFQIANFLTKQLLITKSLKIRHFLNRWWLALKIHSSSVYFAQITHSTRCWQSKQLYGNCTIIIIHKIQSTYGHNNTTKCLIFETTKRSFTFLVNKWHIYSLESIEW